MQIIKVQETSHEKRFIELPSTIYKEFSNYIRPLDKDVKQVFDPNKNKAFRHGECER
jgi:hypothetical protein